MELIYFFIDGIRTESALDKRVHECKLFTAVLLVCHIFPNGDTVDLKNTLVSKAVLIN